MLSYFSSQKTKKTQSEVDFSYNFANSARHEHQMWHGWMIGSYVYAWLPVGDRDWRNYPVLLVDICKEATGRTFFIVAHLYDQNTASQYVLALTGRDRRLASSSLRVWPRDTYILSNHFDLVQESELRTWSRLDSVSIALSWAFDIQTKRLTKCEFPPRTDIGIALRTTFCFRRFLQLPYELRENIYHYVLFDERQKICRSLIYSNSLLEKRKHDQRGLRWSRELALPSTGPLPRLQTPGIFLVCKQVHAEASETVYRTKILVITITSVEDGLRNLNEDWLPDIGRFLRIRIDLLLACHTLDTILGLTGIICECFRRIATLLQERALGLQFLEIRFGTYSLPIRLARYKDVIKYKAVLEGMREFSENFSRARMKISTERGPLNICWGISERQKKAGDYSCTCTYFCARSLEQVWKRVCYRPEIGAEDAECTLAVENCRHMGCKLHVW